MIPLISAESAAVAAWCRRLGVLRLDLFGSAATGAFDPARSDLDFVAEFADHTPTGTYADRSLDFADALEARFKHRVEIVSATAVRGSRSAAEIATTRQPVHVESQPAAV